MNDDEALVQAISAILLRSDPLKLYDEEAGNADEYISEAHRIASALPQCRNQAEFLNQVWRTFLDSFSVESAGSKERYAEVAAKIWKAHGPECGGDGRGGDQAGKRA